MNGGTIQKKNTKEFGCTHEGWGKVWRHSSIFLKYFPNFTNTNPNSSKPFSATKEHQIGPLRHH
jgi:hypothetical protein